MAIKEKKPVNVLNMEAIDTRDKQELHQRELTEDIVEIPLDKDYLTRTIKVNSYLSLEAQA